MPIAILMPALSPTMTVGKLARWLKNEGDAVRSGDLVCEIETDKATMEVEAADEGILGRILVAAGTEEVAVNTPIAWLLADGEDVSALESASIPAPAAKAQSEDAPTPKPVKPPVAPPVEAPAATAAGRIFASPLARRLAADAGLDLAAVKGSGPHGRIVKADVLAALQAPRPSPVRPAAAPVPAAALQPAAAGPAFVEMANSTMRKVIARRLSESKREIPHYYLTIDCNIDSLLAVRQQLNARSPQGDGGYKLSVNDFVVKAVALALRACPDANCSWTDDAIRYYQTVDVCVAVATPNGLITPVVRNADHKGLAALSHEIRYLADRAREGKLVPEEYQGGGFTVSNLGMYGIREFAAIINPPQSCLLAVGAAESRPIVKDGALAVATMMTCTLSADHRSVDGAKGAEFLKAFKRLIEEPVSMLL